MDERVRLDALGIIDRVIGILKSKDGKDTQELKDISNHTIHNASVFQDECSVSIAVLIYALSKVIDRYKEGSLEYKLLLELFESEKKNLQNGDEQSFNGTMKKLFSEISKIDSKINLYVQEVISQAQIKKGSKLCEHGLSCAKASEVLGISQWDLMHYLGKTNLTEENINAIDLKSRLKFAKRLFS